MSKKEPFTIGDVETILLVKALDEYTMFDENDPEYEYSLAEKIERLDLSTGWMDGDVFNAGLDKMEEMGLLVWKNEKEGYRLTEEDVIVWQDEEEGYALTEEGRTLFKKLSLVEGLDDNSVKNILNMSFNTKEFLNKHGNDIKDIIIGVMKSCISK